MTLPASGTTPGNNATETYISDANYNFLIDFLKNQSGLALKGDKKYLLESRLVPIARKHSIPQLDKLVEKLKLPTGTSLLKEVIEEMATHETFFFRDMKPFNHFKKILPELIKKKEAAKSIRIWCAACSSGQEPYSLAMILDEFKSKMPGYRIELYATDLSEKIMSKAKEGIYSQFEVQRGLPTPYLIKHFVQKGTDWHISEELKKMITFKTNNLLKYSAGLGKFDIIFCRNVLFYFDKDDKQRIFADMVKYSLPHAVMYLGGAESVMGYTDAFKPVPGISGVFELNSDDTIIT